MALAVALALHEILAALIPSTAPHRAPQEEAISKVSVTRVTPTPPATPAPRPAPSRVRTAAPVEPQAAPQPRAPALRHDIVRSGAARPKPPKFSNAKPIWDVPAGGQGAASGTATGSGTGGGGSGGLGAGGAQPCGYVEFSDPSGSRYDPKTGGYFVEVAMTVHFSDRRSESLLLDYAWFYPNAASNPWSQQNLDDPGFPTRFQSPPPDKRAGEPPLVQYVIAHSTRDGLTLLKSCP